ncbi:MAG TPA: MFS transporter [Lacipirellulaceae bacterium]|nr:MFS transporter [Lacipirellulaceae bacterium]
MAGQNQARRLFLGCFIAMVATAFGFAVRGGVLNEIGLQFQLTEEQKGILGGVGLFPFAISIILFSLIVDRIGYGVTITFAFICHLVSAILTILSKDFKMLYLATFIYAIANGTVEAVINPVVATVYKDNKTHWLNILHAGWPGGLVLGSLLALGMGSLDKHGMLPASLLLWQWKMTVLMLPILLYGFLLFGQRFPVQERVEAGVSYRDMLAELGWGGAYIVSFLLIMGISQILTVLNGTTIGQTTLHLEPIKISYALLAALVPAIAFGLYVRSFGRPMFVFLLLVMFLLATTELGTDNWIQDIIGTVMKNPMIGTWFFIYTASIMFVLRFCAGPIVHKISPLGLLATCAALAAVGLFWLGKSGTSVGMLLAAATLYGCAKSFFWPTTLGTVSEQYPRGGALLLNAMGGVGMIAVGTIGGPAIGTVQDMTFNHAVAVAAPEVHKEVSAEKTDGQFFNYQYIDKAKVASANLTADQREQLTTIEGDTKQAALSKIAVLPATMCVCYLILIAYFQTKGGYQAEVLTGHAAQDEKFTGGVPGPMEA